MNWNYSNRSYYESMGYRFTKKGDSFIVKIEHLSKGSKLEIEFVCDYCLGAKQTTTKSKVREYKNIIKSRSIINKDCCSACKIIKSKEVEIHNLKINKQTLGDLFPEYLSEWSEKNDMTTYDYSPYSSKKVWWECNEKGHLYFEKIQKKTSMKRGCPYCSGRRISDENRLSMIFPELSNEWNFDKNNELTPYNVSYGSERKVWWICTNCNYEWEAKVYNKVKGSGCPQCFESQGEKSVRNVLESLSLSFKSQYEFKDLKGLNGGLLRFDFAVFDQHDKLLFLIEYDGEYHFRVIFEGDNHETLVKHDYLKNEYCREKNIPLLRIPYWEFGILETKLKEFISSRIEVEDGC